MAGKLSTGLRNFRANGGSLRKAFEDGILNIYSGVAPEQADDAPTGILHEHEAREAELVDGPAVNIARLLTTQDGVHVTATPSLMADGLGFRRF